MHVRLIRARDGRTLLDKGIREYAKLKPSPIIADFMKTMYMVVPDLLNGRQAELLTKDYSKVYEMKGYRRSPAEVAGRYAAKAIVNELMRLDSE